MTCTLDWDSPRPWRTSYFGNVFLHRVPRDFPEPKLIVPLMERIWGVNEPFQHLLQFGGVRYIFHLEYNKEFETCRENECLGVLYQGIACKDMKLLNKGATMCMSLFWPFLEADYKERGKKGIDLVKDKVSCESPVVKIQAKSIDGTLKRVTHDIEFHLYGRPFKNPFPNQMRLITSSELEERTKINNRLHVVTLGGSKYCLKYPRWGRGKDLSGEITKLNVVQGHPNFLSLFGALDAGFGKIAGILVPFICGAPLSDIKFIPPWLQQDWKEQISSAVHYLHELGVVWGDVKPENVMVDGVTRKPILIDFEGGFTEGWVDKSLANTRQGDLQGLQRLLDFIDRRASERGSVDTMKASEAMEHYLECKGQLGPAMITRTFQGRPRKRIPPDFAYRDLVKPLLERVWISKGPFQHIVDVGEVRYNFLIDYNEDESSPESVALQKIYDGLEQNNDTLVSDGSYECLKMCWSFLKEDYEKRAKSHMNDAHAEEKNPMIRLKSEDGKICVMQHDMQVNLPARVLAVGVKVADR